jgi:hypothetical protein
MKFHRFRKISQLMRTNPLKLLPKISKKEQKEGIAL